MRRCWYVRYQVGHGRAGRRRGNDPIGDVKHWSVGQAWEEASRIIRLAESGTGPKAQREAAEASVANQACTVAVVYQEWLDHPARPKTLRARSRENYEHQFEAYIEPHLGEVPFAKLNKDNIGVAIEKIRLATTNPDRGGAATKA